jgi:hypothetical protein
MPPLPAPPRQSRLAPWLLLALLWGLTTASLVVGAEVATALGG